MDPHVTEESYRRIAQDPAFSERIHAEGRARFMGGEGWTLKIMFSSNQIILRRRRPKAIPFAFAIAVIAAMSQSSLRIIKTRDDS